MRMYINRGLPIALKAKFDKVFIQNLFDGQVSRSGNGSSTEQTSELIQEFPGLLSRLGVKSILDIPCGDLTWMKKVDLQGASYRGADVAPSLISYLQSEFPDRRFEVLDISKDPLPKVDLIFCRDLFVHLSFKDIRLAISNIKASRSTYIATTTFLNRKKNSDLPLISRGVAWRTINLQIQPFDFDKSIEIIDEKCTENNGQYSDKAIGVWKIDELP